MRREVLTGNLSRNDLGRIFDRDGVINVDHGYVSTWERFEFLPGVPDALRALQDAGYLLIVVSNQSGIGRGYYCEADVESLNQAAQHLARLASALGVLSLPTPPHRGGG